MLFKTEPTNGSFNGVNKKGKVSPWKLKNPNINVQDLNPKLYAYLEALPADLQKGIVVTAGKEDGHSVTGGHGKGNAIDIRLNKTDGWDQKFMEYLEKDSENRKNLGIAFLDPNHGSAPHIHLSIGLKGEMANDYYYGRGKSMPNKDDNPVVKSYELTSDFTKLQDEAKSKQEQLLTEDKNLDAKNDLSSTQQTIKNEEQVFNDLQGALEQTTQTENNTEINMTNTFDTDPLFAKFKQDLNTGTYNKFLGKYLAAGDTETAFKIWKEQINGKIPITAANAGIRYSLNSMANVEDVFDDPSNLFTPVEPFSSDNSTQVVQNSQDINNLNNVGPAIETQMAVNSNVENISPTGNTDTTSDDVVDKTLDKQKSFWEYMAKNPMLGMGLGLEDRFRIAGQSLAYNPSFLGNSDLEKSAKKANTITGIAAVGSGLFGAARNVLAGVGEQKRINEFNKTFYKDMKDLQVGDSKYIFRDGGSLQMPIEKQMTNEFISGLPKSMEDMSNAELEVDEYVKHPDNSIQKVWGSRHEDGGEKVILEDNTDIISDNIKVGSKLSAMLKTDYGVIVKPNATIADAMDKFSEKIGLAELNEELEEKMKLLEKSSTIKDKATKELNISFLREEIAEIESKRKDLLSQRVDFFDFLFDKQEAIKDNKFRDGGKFSSGNFEAMCKKHGLTKEEGLEMLKESYMKNGGSHKNEWISNKIKTLMDEGKPQKQAIAIAFSMYEQKMADGGKITLWKGDSNPSTDPVTKTTSSNWNAASDLAESDVNDLATKLGFFDSAEYKATDSTDVNVKFQKFLYNNYKDIVTATHSDAKFGNPNSGMFDGKLGVRWSTALKEIRGKVQQVQEPEKQVEPTAQTPIDNLDLKSYKKSGAGLFVPGTFNLPPESLIGSAKREFRVSPIDPSAISAEQNLKESYRLFDVASDFASGLPAGMGASVNANNLATVIEANNKAITETNRLNASNRQTTEQANSTLNVLDEQRRYDEIPRYEELSLTALDKTMNDLKNFIDTNYQNQQKRFAFINNANIINSMFDNVSVDAFGVPSVDPKTVAPFTVNNPNKK